MIKELSLVLLMILWSSRISFSEDNSSEARWSKFDNKILTLLNEPEIGGVAEFKITPAPCITKREIDVTCDIPVGWELINEQAYIITGKGEQDIKHLSRESRRIRFWKGYVNPGEIREIFFQARIPDGEDYILRVYGGCDSEFFELDLGQPEPPEWNHRNKKWHKVKKENTTYKIGTGIYDITTDADYYLRHEILIDEGQTSPILSELKARTKHNPYLGGGHDPEEVPLRYLVYTDVDAEDVVVTVSLPWHLELIDEGNYQVTKNNDYTDIKLFQGQMKAKESKAFYFKIRSNSPDKRSMTGVGGDIKVLTADSRKLITHDSESLSF